MSDDQVSTAIELKYKTRKLEAVIKDEPFFLRDHAATDLARYDFWKDVQRLEQVASKSKAEAFAIIITNDSALWGTSKRQDTFDAEFKINDGRHLSSEVMHWHEETSVGTRKGREPNIVLRGDYNLRWQQYSLLKDVRNGDFRVLILKIN